MFGSGIKHPGSATLLVSMSLQKFAINFQDLHVVLFLVPVHPGIETPPLYPFYYSET
jgi:hypothetical protein